MRSSSKLTVGLAILATLVAVDSAPAYYHPGTGRFLSRDPIGDPGAMLVRQVAATTAFILRDGPGGESPNRYGYAYNSPLNWIDPDGLAAQETQPSPPTTQPQDPVDICKLLGNKGCDPTRVPPGPVKIPLNLLTALGQLNNACGYVTINSVSNCTDNLKWRDVALAGGKPCSQIKVNMCSLLSQYADNKKHDFPCMKKQGEEWIEDPDKECCYKASFSGSYDVEVPVSLTVPVAGDKNGKNGGLCVITGNVKASLKVPGELGQCQNKAKK